MKPSQKNNQIHLNMNLPIHSQCGLKGLSSIFLLHKKKHLGHFVMSKERTCLEAVHGYWFE